MKTLTQRNVLEALETLERDLDLTLMRAALADSEEGPGWSTSQLDSVELAYRRFLALKMAFPDEDVVPTKAIDQMWHAHILDTAKYAEDCQHLFGTALDHFPYFGVAGMGDENSPEALDRAFARTLQLWNEHFGSRPPGPADNAVAKCRTKCKPMKCK